MRGRGRQGGMGVIQALVSMHTTGECSKCGDVREGALQVWLLCTPNNPSAAAKLQAATTFTAPHYHKRAC